MDMCYDGTLVMPSNCVVMDEEEMTYVDGGQIVSGAGGWAVAASFGVCAAFMTAVTAFFGTATALAFMVTVVGAPTIVLGIFGALATIMIGCSAAVVACVAACLTTAAAKATYFMGTSGQFRISCKFETPWDFIQISRV